MQIISRYVIGDYTLLEVVPVVTVSDGGLVLPIPPDEIILLSRTKRAVTLTTSFDKEGKNSLSGKR